MTGLNPETDSIIEIAATVTNTDLKVIEEGPNLVVYQDDGIFKTMDKWNQTQHKKSGLWKEVIASSLKVKDAENVLISFIKKHFSPKEKALIAGNSIWQDRRFITKYMPRLHEYFHYRMIDVSSLKLLAKHWYPKLSIPQKGTNHRAKEDINDSIKELKFYKEHIFVENC